MPKNNNSKFSTSDSFCLITSHIETGFCCFGILNHAENVFEKYKAYAPFYIKRGLLSVIFWDMGIQSVLIPMQKCSDVTFQISISLEWIVWFSKFRYQSKACKIVLQKISEFWFSNSSAPFDVTVTLRGHFFDIGHIVLLPWIQTLLT